MRYVPPQIIRDFTATDAVQSLGLPVDQKAAGGIPDSPVDPMVLTTASAYESDE